MAASEVSICSNALQMLGDEPIAAFDEGTRRAQVAANLYPYVRNDILRAHTWNCAIKRVLLAPEVNAPAFGFRAQFALPGDFVRVVQVGYDGQDLPYQVESGKVLCDANPLPLRYVWRNENPATWDEALVFVMQLAMAAQLAYPITKSGSVEENRFAQLREALRRAKAIDGQDNPAEDIGSIDLLQARFRSRY